MTDTTPTNDAVGREMIAELRALLGSKLVAYLAGIHSTDTIRHWTAGTTPLPDRTVLGRFQVALDAVHLIAARDNPAVAQTWFQGRNPALGDQPPAKVLRDENLDSDRSAVLAAASEFATHSC